VGYIPGDDYYLTLLRVIRASADAALVILNTHYFQLASGHCKAESCPLIFLRPFIRSIIVLFAVLQHPGHR
jgi:hypothetical protein